MLIHGDAPNEIDIERKLLQERILREGLELWKKQQEATKLRKFKEQKEMKELLEHYWPWGKSKDIKPRGLRNLRLEGLFPNKDFENAKRQVGGIILGRPGGGAPLFTEGGKKITKTKEDPMLRFQFGNDLRRCVDNSLRYKKNKAEQETYKKQLDQMVREKRQKEEEMKRSEIEFYKKQGWSTEETLKNLSSQSDQRIDKCKKSKNRTKLEPLNFPNENFVTTGLRKEKVTSLRHCKEDDVDLVTLFAKQRNFPIKIPLCSTDATNERKISKNNLNSIWMRQGSSYLKELTRQMCIKQEKTKEITEEEKARTVRHFATWDGFWGRPGNGAPGFTIKKQRLDKLLYPKMVPIAVN